jgi:hypothetical protein
MARAKIIVNPYAGRWKGRRSVPAIEVALKEAGMDFDQVCTAGPDHAIELARETALEGYRPVVAAGGDGIIGEVVNGLCRRPVIRWLAPGPLSLLVWPMISSELLGGALGLQSLIGFGVMVISGATFGLILNATNAPAPALGYTPWLGLRQLGPGVPGGINCCCLLGQESLKGIHGQKTDCQRR